MSLVRRSLIRHPYFRALERFRRLAAPQASEPDGYVLLAFRYASDNATDKQSQKAKPPKQAKELTHGEQRSYLEEVFIKREQEPKTTAQKGQTTLRIPYLLQPSFSKEDGREHLLLLGSCYIGSSVRRSSLLPAGSVLRIGLAAANLFEVAQDDTRRRALPGRLGREDRWPWRGYRSRPSQAHCPSPVVFASRTLH